MHSSASLPPAAERRCVVVGMLPGQPDDVILQAVGLAEDLGAELVFASVDLSRYLVEEHPDGSIVSMPVDPDLPELEEAVFDTGLEQRLRRLLISRDLVWEVRELAGDPARALSHLANTLDAQAIIVGTRDHTFRAGVQEFFNGSVAVHLAHRQHRPVIVIPVSPVLGTAALPWEEPQ